LLIRLLDEPLHRARRERGAVCRCKLHLTLDTPLGQDSNGSRSSILPATTNCLISVSVRPTAKRNAFLTFDLEYSNSILSCLRAQGKRAFDPGGYFSEMWEQVNRFYLMVQAAAKRLKSFKDQQIFSPPSRSDHLFNALPKQPESQRGLALSHPWPNAGTRDKTSRILDVKYFLLLRSVADVGTPFDDIHWAACCGRRARSRCTASALPDLPEGSWNSPAGREFPARFGLSKPRARVPPCHIGTPLHTFRNPAERSLDSFAQSAYAQVKEVLRSGLHEYLDDLQTKVNQVGQPF